MSRQDDSSGRKTGRPAKRDGPKVPYDEIDRLLVHGEVVEAKSGGATTTYPSYRELARRYGCSHSLIAQYARKHDCLRRRKEAKARVVAKTSQKLVEMRAQALALSKDDALRIIDTYLAGFEESLADGRVRFDNPTDFNTMVRLKEFIQGGADSRQEIHAALSLDDIQARHQRMLKSMEASTSAEQGAVEQNEAAPTESSRQLPRHSPAPPTDAEPQEMPVQPGHEPLDPPRAPHGHPSRARPGAPDHEPRGGGSAPHGPDVAPVGPGVAELGGVP